MYFQLSSAHSKGLGQGQALFDCEYLANGDRYANSAFANEQKVAYGLSVISKLVSNL